MKPGKRCTLYSVLTEICLVTRRAVDGGNSWEIATTELGKPIGCVDQVL